MSVLTVPPFPSHLLKTGLLTESEFRECPSEDLELQTDFLAKTLAHCDLDEVAKSVRRAWEGTRRDAGILQIACVLEREVQRARLNCFLQWRLTDGHVCEQTFHRLQGLLVKLTTENQELQKQARRTKETESAHATPSFDSSAQLKTPSAFTRESAESCHERLYANAKDKEQIQTLLARVKAERETIGCTFRPDTASSTLSYANSQTCSVFAPSRHSTPCKSPDAGSSAPSPPQVAIFDRLFSQDREKRNTQRQHEAAKLEKETENCTFQPKVNRSRTPDPRGNRCLQLHDNYADMLRKRRVIELRQSEMEMKGLTFAPALCQYRPKGRRKDGPGSESPSKRNGAQAKRVSVDLSSASSQV